MPSLGSDMEFGTIVEWRVKPGDSVKRGDVVALVETEKGVIEVEIFEEGVIDALQVEPGKKVPVGTPLATLTSNEAAPVGAAKAEYLEAPANSEAPLARDEADREKPEAPPADAAPIPAPSLELPGRPRISPYARKRAQELGAPIERIAASGGHGAIVAADIERAAAAKGDKGHGKPTHAAARKADAQAAMRKVIATAMARAKREIPHYYLSTTIDLSAALNWLASANANRPVTKRIIYSALLLRAVTLAAREVPEMNGFYKNEGFDPSATVNLGVAIGLRQGGPTCSYLATRIPAGMS